MNTIYLRLLAARMFITFVVFCTVSTFVQYSFADKIMDDTHEYETTHRFQEPHTANFFQSRLWKKRLLLIDLRSSAVERVTIDRDLQASRDALAERDLEVYLLDSVSYSKTTDDQDNKERSQTPCASSDMIQNSEENDDFCSTIGFALKSSGTSKIDSRSDVSDLIQRFQKDQSPIILIGKDGATKTRQQILNVPAILLLIDRMPMRQAEMRKQKGLGEGVK